MGQENGESVDVFVVFTNVIMLNFLQFKKLLYLRF